jgi:hypothetical protein
MTSTNKYKGEDEIDFNVVFLICEFIYSPMQITFEPKYFAQNYFVQVLYIWAKGIQIWSIFLGAQTSTPFKILELLVLNHKNTC